jgi:hypothetical protein
MGTKLTLSSLSERRGTAAASAAKQVVTLLSQEGFQLGDIDEDSDLPIVQAVRNGCHILVAVVSPLGWHRDSMRQLAKSKDRILFVVDGEFYREQPRWRTLTYYYWRRLNGYAGRRLPARPVLGLVASPKCSLQDIAWQKLVEPQ